MEEIIEECYCGDFEEPNLNENQKKIIKKQKETCICQIIIDNQDEQKSGTGFFCKIPYKGDIIPVLMTNYHVIGDDYLNNHDYLKLVINKTIPIKMKLDKERKLYSSINKKDMI